MILAAVNHVLEDDHTVLIAVVVEQIRLDFDVLAQHVKTELFHGQDIVTITLRCGGKVDAVAVVSLIQKAVEEHGFSVQTDIGLTVGRLDSDGAQGKIGFDRILAIGQSKGVQIRVVWGPKNGGVNFDGDLITLIAVTLCAVFKLDHDRFFVLAALGFDGNAVERRSQLQGANVIQRNTFHPHWLPDAADGSIPHAAALVALFAVREGVIQFVGHPNCDLILACTDEIGDVQRKGVVSADVFTSFLAVDADFSQLIHCAKVKQKPSAPHLIGQIECAAVDILLTYLKRASDPGDAGFRREGNANRAEVGFQILLFDPERPFSAQRKIGISFHLGTGIIFPAGGRIRFKRSDKRL